MTLNIPSASRRPDRGDRRRGRPATAARPAVQPAARPGRPPAAAGAGTLRAGGLRGDRRPGPQEAAAGDLRPGQPGPAAGRLRAAGFRPPGLGGRRLRDAGQEGRQGARPDRLERGGVEPAVRRRQVRAGLLRRRRRLRHAGQHPGRAARQPRHQGQCGVLPVHPAQHVPDRAQADGAHQDGRQRHLRRLAAGGGGKAVRARPGQRQAAQPAGRLGVHRRRRLPDRPLPGQGDRAEPDGAAVRQPAVRAGLERQLRRLGADHDGRGRRHRRSGGVLRRDRRGPRRAAEPPAATARADRDGGAGGVHRRGDPDREAQGVARDHAAGRPGRYAVRGPVPAGLAGR